VVVVCPVKVLSAPSRSRFRGQENDGVRGLSHNGGDGGLPEGGGSEGAEELAGTDDQNMACTCVFWIEAL
jgi:hypothetical protein